MYSGQKKKKKTKPTPTSPRGGKGGGGGVFYINKIYFPRDTVTLRRLAPLSLQCHKRQIYDLIFSYLPEISILCCEQKRTGAIQSGVRPKT